jgi:hypothetical protein
MTVTSGHDLYYDPYDVRINADPYPVFRRLREAAQLYYNERYDEWEVDLASAELASTSTVRGWETLPVVIP